MSSHPISLTSIIWVVLYIFCDDCPEVLETFTFILEFGISGSFIRIYGTSQDTAYLEMLCIVAMSSKAMFNKTGYF